MDWLGLTINLIAIFAGLGLYIWIGHTKWGKEHQEYQYAIMLAAILAACLVGGVLRVVVGYFVN